jgi:hypothetical protein
MKTNVRMNLETNKVMMQEKKQHNTKRITTVKEEQHV